MALHCARVAKKPAKLMTDIEVKRVAAFIGLGRLAPFAAPLRIRQCGGIASGRGTGVACVIVDRRASC